MLSRTAVSAARRVSLAWAMVGFTAATLADPVISEFMAFNDRTLADSDGDFSDWIEIYNPDATAVTLTGWTLTDSVTDKTQWKFPAVTIAPGGYLVVFASNKNRKDPAQELHANFGLSKKGGYLGLYKPDGTTVASEYTAYPAMPAEIAYGITQPTDSAAPRTGLLRTPSPRKRNPDLIYLPDAVVFSRAPGLFTGSFTLTMSGAPAGAKIYYTSAAPSSSGATASEPTTASTLYSGPISINSPVVIRATVFSADNKSSGLPAMAHYAPFAAQAASFSTSLPVMVLDSHGTGTQTKDSIYHPAWLYVFAPGANGQTTLTGTPQLATPMGMTVRGNFSSNFPKKSYSLELLDQLGANNPEPLLGLDKDRQWDLYGPWSTDRSYIRNIFVYELSNRIGRWAPRTKIVETFVNVDNDGVTTADYTGLALLIDRLKITKDRIDLATLKSTDLTGSDVTGGYLLKIDPIPDLTHFNFITSRGAPSFLPGSTGIIVEDPDGSSLKPAQRDYIRNYVQTMENSLYAGRAAGWATRDYLDYVDLPSWVDHHLMKCFFGDVDAFWHSDYFAKDKNRKMVSGPVWDFDGSMGYDPGDPRAINPTTWDTTGGRDVWNYDWWGQLLHDPEAMQAWIDRWQGLRRNEFANASLNAAADEIAARIPADAAARDVARWPDNASRYPGGFLGEVAHMKDWITRRADWIDAQFLAAPTVSTTGATVTFTAPARAQLVYTLDGSDPRSLGGAIPTNAITATSPLSLPANSNVHVRSYNFELINTYPGSIWSSVVAGLNASAVLPRSRLSNLSVLTNLAASDSLTMGFVVGPSGTGGSKPLVARAAGPSLSQFAVPSPNPDPQLQLFAGSTKVTENNDWNGDSTVSKAFTQVGAFPFTGKSSKDAAVFSPAVASGSNSVVVSGVGTAAGNVIAELYDATQGADYTSATPRLINVSVLKNLGEGLTVGFVVGPAGSPSKKVLIRAVGPTLGAAPFNVPGVVADPQMTLFGPSGQIDQNDNWGGTAVLRDAFASVAAFALPASSLDSAIVATLTPGNYTVQVKGVNNTSGIALVEVYELP